ncbi:Surface polysaccharide O-acyltransferase, integral membrane enzyme [Pseudobutyrivibrio sp. 49]|uniref:acyltransferase family protein n=1 Tax=Pseudobutyrivibrio sp. 49 TaxID=1855344 RepID=UPI000892638C|nr:acyltransferase family protein [Pseudobutyrivibrio sp. 49]SDH60789.1 Surface polysaccharide O-acyltransferase, integral membrane enzyme [Pseudobutyrivibrio sp. 49]
MKRNYGIDLLRIISTYGIIIAHILGWGGVIESLEPNSMKYVIIWTLELMVVASINCYALISGYVGVESKYKVENIVLLLVRTIFHTLMITLFFFFYLPGTVSVIDWKNALFPIMSNQYWYLNAYVGLFIFIPVLNTFVNSNYKYSNIVNFVLLFVFSLYATISVDDLFFTNKGYSIIWLMILYIIGGMMKKANREYKKVYAIVIYILSLSIGVACIYFWGLQDKVRCFQSPILVATSLCLMILFTSMKIGDRFAKVIKILSPTTFFIYIIHVNPFIWNLYIHNRFAFLAQMSGIKMMAAILVIALGIFVACFVLDKIRAALFALFKIDEKIIRICNIIKTRGVIHE